MATNGKNGNGGSAGTARRRRRNQRQRVQGKAGFPRWLIAAITLSAAAFIGLIVMFAVALSTYSSYSEDLVAPDELAINKPSYGAKIYDRNGVLLYEYLDDTAGLRRPVEIENVADAFLASTISTEDDTFFTNPGVNMKGLIRAAWENFSPLSDTPGVLEGSGGSSITQQLVKNVYIPIEERQQRSIDRKIRETIYAIELTQRYSKDQILEWYVNQISYAGVYNGVEAASQGYFGKPANDLTLAEAALLAGIPQSPAEYDPVNRPEAAKARRNEVLELLLRQGRIQIGENKFFEPTLEQIEAAKAEEISISVKSFPIRAPHWVLQYVQPQLEQLFTKDALFRDGLVVTTTLDIELQDETQEIMNGWIQEFENISNSHNGAMVIIDPKTGEILTMIGSRDYFREDIEGKNNNATALNSPGSAFKPFVYMMSFMRLGWGPGTVILDTPVRFPQPNGQPDFVPANPSGNFQGPVTLRNALGNSLNIPAVKVADATGVDYIVQQARKMGLTGLSGGYGPAIATGGVEITPLELTYAYSVMANGGIMRGQTPLVSHRTGERKIDPVSILKVTDTEGRVRFDADTRRAEERVVPEEYTYLVSSILSDGSAQCITFGCGGITVPGRQVAVKTGTSEPFDPRGPNAGKIGETWAFGYTPDIVVGIWAGNADNAPVVNIFSTSISFRAMRDSLQNWYDGAASTSFRRPANVVEETVCVPSGKLPTPLCGKTTKDLFAGDGLPKDQDDWWKQIRVDARTNLLASPTTPPQFVQERVMLVLPPDLLKTEEDKKRAQEWADALGIALAPTEVSTAVDGPLPPGGIGSGGNVTDLPAIIFTPTAGQSVSGPVLITGRAASPAFVVYRLEFGAGLSPANWTTITQATGQVASGPLGSWDTTALQPGVYTIRLVVQDGQRGLITSTTSVNIGLPPTPTASPTPTGRP